MGKISSNATKTKDKELKIIFDKHFKFLTEEFGFTIDSSQYDSGFFGNFVMEFSKGPKKIRITSDRSQIFIDIFDQKLGWVDKDDILQTKGILSTRFETTNQLWDGYEIQNQSMDLKKNKDLLNI